MNLKNWKYYNFGIIPSLAPNQNVEIEKGDITSHISILKKIYFARWTSDFDSSSKTKFWYIIKDSFSGMDELSSNTRSKVLNLLRHECEDKTMIIVTHDKEIYEIVDRVIDIKSIQD